MPASTETRIWIDGDYCATNFGTTHITNGSYQLHPVEWKIGEAAGPLAAFVRSPLTVVADAGLLAAFQRSLLAEGVPLAWAIDAGVGHRSCAAVQRRLMAMPMARDAASLELRPDDRLESDAWQTWGGRGEVPATRAEAAERLSGA